MTDDEFWNAYDNAGTGANKTPPESANTATQPEETLLQCVNARIGHIRIKQPVFVLMLEHPTNGMTATKYLGCKVTKAGNLSVSRNSDFAKLFRLSTGTNPAPRLSRADKLLSHFLTVKFWVTTEKAKDRSGKEYNRVTSIRPEQLCFSTEWTATGTLLNPKKNHKSKPTTPKLVGKNKANTGQLADKSDANSEQFFGNAEMPHPQKVQGIEECFDSINHLTLEHKAIDQLPKPVTVKQYDHFFDDDRRHCVECRNLVNRYCLAAKRGEIEASTHYRPVDDLPRRCKAFTPRVINFKQHGASTALP